MESSEGVVYIATGEEYIREAIVSAKSLKNCMPDLEVTLFTDINIDIDNFDDIRIIQETRGDYGDSILKPEMVCYDRTLFLDTDTFVTEDISELFVLLDKFDLAATHNPGSRTPPEDQNYSTQSVPDSFPLYNTGVIALRRNQEVFDFLTDWISIYNNQIEKVDSQLNQPAFREALYYSDVEVATLPSEYNCRIRYDGSTGFLTSDVKIVHGRHPEGLEKISNLLNSKSGMRVFSFRSYPIKIATASPSLYFYIRSLLSEDNKHYTYRGRFLNSVKERGYVNTMKRVVRSVKKSIKE